MAPSIKRRSSSEMDMAAYTNCPVYRLSDFIAKEPEPADDDEDSEDPEWSEDFKYTYDGERIMPKRKASLTIEDVEPEMPVAKVPQPEEKVPEIINRWKPRPHNDNPFWPAQDLRRLRNKWVLHDKQARIAADKAYCLSFTDEELDQKLEQDPASPDLFHILLVRMAERYRESPMRMAAEHRSASKLRRAS